MSQSQVIRVLIVDDSIVARRVVSDVLGQDPNIVVAGVAPNGRIGLELIERHHPDLVVLDMEMPELDGLGTLSELRRKWPRLPVVMFSTLTRRGAVATLDALALGASDYVTKPEGTGSPAEAVALVRDQLLAKIRGLCGPVARTRIPPRPAPVPRASNARIAAVVIATSTGGPNALAEVVPSLPADFPVPVLIVQHMPPMFTGLLAERLNARSPLEVREAVPGAIVAPGTVWIAPGDFHMAVARRSNAVHIELNQAPPENSCRPAADVLFRSAGQVFGAGTLGVVMTGMGQDGLRGAQEIRKQGGSIIVQDEPSSVVWGMPGYVVQAGLAESVLPLPALGPSIVSRVRPRPVAVR